MKMTEHLTLWHINILKYDKWRKSNKDTENEQVTKKEGIQKLWCSRNKWKGDT
jgi:hypothetical protein